MLTDADFTDLHVHSSFSLLDGAANPEQLLEASQRLGRKHMAVTDHGNVDGWLRFQKAAKKMDVKPIFGIELFMLENFEERHTGKPKNLHLTAIAKTEQGLGKLVQACGFANMEGMGKSGYAARPFLPMDYPIVNKWPGDVIIMTGCASSPFWNAADGIELLGYYADAFKGDLYAEIMPNEEFELQKTINASAMQAASYFGIKPVVTTDIHYISPEDSEFHEVVIGLSQKYMTWSNPKRWKFESHNNYVHNITQLVESLMRMGLTEEQVRQMVFSTSEIAEKTIHKIHQPTIKLPPVIGDISEEEERERFLQLVLDGLRTRGVANTPGYLERVAAEYDIIAPKGFVRYMLMVWDVVRWAKSHGILIGPARGSVGGSLVAFALGITDIDPIKYRLWFERFIDPERIDMPDIDIDIEDRNRHLVEQYLKEKYGQWNVAHVSTFASMLGKMALKDVGRLFEVPLAEVQKMCNCIIHAHESDVRAHLTIQDTIASGDATAVEFQKKYPHVVHFAQKLEGQVRGCGIHAAGFVISDEDLRTSARAYLVTRRDKVTINWDKNDAESMGFVKLDLLGLQTLSAVAEASRLIEARHGRKIDFTQLPLDDPKTYEMIQRGDTVTCFQINTPSMQRYCAKLKPENFEHLAAITALWRPGPIQSGAADMYAKCKNGLEPVHYASDAFKSITEISYGQMIYQEQVAQMLMKLAGYTYAQADKVRKIVSKKGGVQAWDDEEPKFVAGCEKIGLLNPDQAHELWQSSKMFALYAFNRAHSVGYGMLAYWTAYLKANYPAEWLCSFLNYGNADREDLKTGEINRDVALREALRSGIEILVPDINESDVIWTVATTKHNKPALRVGLQDIKFVGETAVEEIQKLKSRTRQIETLEKFVLEGVDRRCCNKKVIKALFYCGAFDQIISPDIYDRWVKQYDQMYDTMEKPKKRAELLATAVPEGEKQEIIARERNIFLRFDPLAIDGANAAERMAKILGGTLDLDAEEPFIQRGELKWPVSDATLGLLPGANGVLGERPADVRQIRKDTKDCQLCDLRGSCKAPVPVDPGQLDIMVVAEAPGKNEDKVGKPLIGDSGNVLWPELERLGVSREMVYVSNSVKCLPPAKTKPTPEQIDGCPWLEKEIKAIKPKTILALGNSALYYFTGKEKGIMEMNGKTEWNTKANAWVTFCIHPANLLYAREAEELASRELMFREALTEFARVIFQFA